MTFDEAILVLKKTVKYSNIDGQKHLDAGQLQAQHRDQFMKAMVAVRSAVQAGEKSEEDLKLLLGLD